MVCDVAQTPHFTTPTLHISAMQKCVICYLSAQSSIMLRVSHNRWLSHSCVICGDMCVICAI